MKEKELLRKTKSTCPICYKELDAVIMHNSKKVTMEKRCPDHGEFSINLSSKPDYFVPLSKAYFSIMPDNLPVRVLELALNPKCSLDCPICSVMPSIGQGTDLMELKDIEIIMQNNPYKELTLWGLEPMEHPSIEEIFHLFKRHRKATYLFTNGFKLSDMNFLRKLNDIGLSNVYLQFDGFDNNVYKVLRNKDLLENKLQVLENLKKLKIPTVLNVTLAKKLNENQINRIIDYAAKNDFIRQVAFLPLIKIGKADKYRDDIVPDYYEFLQIIEEKTQGRIKLDSLRAFQKLMYIVYRFTKFRRCFWFNLYVLIRNKDRQGYKTIDDFLDLVKVEKIIDCYMETIKDKPRFIYDLILLLRLITVISNLKTFNLFLGCLRFIVKGRKLRDSRLNTDFIFISYTDFCDFYKMDLSMSSKYCEEMMVLKDKKGNIIYKPTYMMLIDKSRDNFSAI